MINEPSGNHVLKLPNADFLMYINSGGIPEYVMVIIMYNDSKDFEEKLVEIIENYDFYYKKMETYPFDSEIMSKNYLDLFESMIQTKDKYKKKKIQNKELYIESKIFEFKRKKVNFCQ